MLQYNSIPVLDLNDIPIQKGISFDKLDGQNIRIEWSNNKSFYKYGTRHILLDNNSDLFKSIKLILDTDYYWLDEFIRKTFNTHSLIIFFEYWGDNSFKGIHDSNDKMKLTIIDVHIKNKGLIIPSDLINIFKDYNVLPDIIHTGYLTDDFIKSIKNLENKEGIIFKYLEQKKKITLLKMVKIKSLWWLNKVKNKFGEEEYNKEI